MNKKQLMPKEFIEEEDFFIGPGGPHNKDHRRIMGPSGVCFYCGAILYGNAGHHANCAEIRQMYKEIDKEILKKGQEDKPICFSLYDEEFEETNECNKCNWYVACTITADHHRKQRGK